MNSVEELSSRSLYTLNKELLALRNQKTERKISISKIKHFYSYLLQGNFKRIFQKTNDMIGNHRGSVDDYPLRDYSRFPDVKVAVYTCVWGRYDEIHEPLYLSPNLDYYIITDQDIKPSSAWKKKELPESIINKLTSPIEVNRFCKMLPHRIFQDYDYSIYIDGNIIVVADLMPLISDMEGKPLAVHSYPLTDCIYEMGKSIAAGKKAKKVDINAQLRRYKQEGFPQHYGAFECNILIRDHHSANCNSLMESWWDEFCNTPTKRDQLSFAFVLWKRNYNLTEIHSLGPNVRFNPRFQIQNHVQQK